MNIFPTDYIEILNRIDSIDPIRYSATRNFKNGHVTKLSPYISRGVISTRFVYEKLVEKGYNLKKCEKFIQELAWRDFWQQIWVTKGNLIDKDLKRPQEGFIDNMIAKSIIKAETGINSADKEIRNLYGSGYMHNHMRMYIASIATNISKSHWKLPAKWMYYHLLDGDWASNGLSWQWVAGSNSNKKYYANQDNINKYFEDDQRNTFLDKSYEEIINMDIPKVLNEKINFEYKTSLPEIKKIEIDNQYPTLIYNYYNIDPNWRKDEKANRILLLEPEIFTKYPVSEKCIQFALKLSENINEIQIFSGSFENLKAQHNINNIIFKEHPLNKHYFGDKDERDWLFKIEGEYLSFFKYWNKIRKKLI
jgi:deoxyribodipyrimidine photo-lyase